MLKAIADLYNDIGDFNNALKYQEMCLDYLTKYFNQELQAISACYNNIGLILKSTTKYDDALCYLFNSLKTLEKISTFDGNINLYKAACYNNIGEIYYFKGNSGDNFDKAKGYYDKAIMIKKAELGIRHVDVAVSYFGLASLYRSKTSYEKSLCLNYKSLIIYQKNTTDEPNYDAEVSEIYNNLG